MILRTSFWKRFQNRKPRASGDDPDGAPCPIGGGGVNPARAGMIRAFAWALKKAFSKPRASGDDPKRSCVNYSD